MGQNLHSHVEMIIEGTQQYGRFFINLVILWGWKPWNSPATCLPIPVKHGWNSHANYWIKGWVFSKKSPLVSVQHSFGESPFY